MKRRQTIPTMIFTSLTLGLSALLTEPASGLSSDLLALRVGRAETIANGTIENAVVLIDGDEIVIVGEDLPIERGIPVVDLPDAVVMPGLVNCRSRFGLDSRAGTGSTPDVLTADELYTAPGPYPQLLEAGVTAVALYPPGRGVMGQAAVIQTDGDSIADMLLESNAYLAMTMGADRSAKKLIRDAFEKVDDYLEDVEKEREKWKKKNAKKDEDEVDPFEPEVPDAEVLPLLRFVTGDLRGQFSIRKSADLLHLWDVLAEQEDVVYDLHIPLRDEIDLFYVADRIGERDLRVICEPVIVDHPGTRRERNLPDELARAGAKLAFLPRASESVQSHRDWVGDVGQLVAYGLDRQVALRAMTLEPAEAIGMGHAIGSIEAGKRADLLIFDGDPFERTTKLQAVLLGGKLVHGELYQ